MANILTTILTTAKANSTVYVSLLFYPFQGFDKLNKYQSNKGNTGLDWVFYVPATQYRLHVRRFLQVRRPN